MDYGKKTKAKNMFTYGQPQIDLPDLQMTVLELWIGCWWFPNLGKKMRIHCQGTYSEKEVIMQYQIPHIYINIQRLNELYQALNSGYEVEKIIL